MSKFKRGISRILIVFLVLLAVSVVMLAYFFIANDAPLLEGEVRYHIPYKDKLTLDVYFPTVEVYDKTPVVLFIHGGAWIAGRKESVNMNRFHGAFNTLRANGYAIVSPEYTLAKKDQAPFPACIEDAFAAVSWISENASDYNFDLENFTLFGESAGAHIAMMLAYAQPNDFNLPFEKQEFNCIVDVYGPSDLNLLYHSEYVDSVAAILGKLPEGLRNSLDISHRLFGFDPSEDSLKTHDFAREYAPVEYIHSGAPPTLIIHGTEDQVVPIDQSEVLLQQLSLYNINHESHKLDGANHGFIGATDIQKDSVQACISTFVRNHYTDRIP